MADSIRTGYTPTSTGYAAEGAVKIPTAPNGGSGSTLRTPSVTVNLIKAVRDNGAHAIAELDEQIDELDDRRARLVAERETIAKMLTIATEHKDHVQR